MNKSLFAIAIPTWMALFCGCIVVGVNLKEEIAYRVESHDPCSSDNLMEGGEDAFSRSDIRNPRVEVEFADAEGMEGSSCLMTVSATFEQVSHIADSVNAVKETYAVDDGMATSIGLFPGIGRGFYSEMGYGTLKDVNTGVVNEGFCKGGASVVVVPLTDALMNCVLFGAPTLSSLLVAPFDDEPSEFAQMGLIGCDRFETGNRPGRNLIRAENELTYLASESASEIRQGLDVPILATIEIPSLSHLECVCLEPVLENGKLVSKATVRLPGIARGSAGTVTLSFPENAWRCGDGLRKFEGTKLNF